MNEITPNRRSLRNTQRLLEIHVSVMVALTLVAAVPGIPLRVFIAAALTIWGVVFFAVFYLVGQTARPRPIADAVTGFRLALGIAMFVLAWQNILTPIGALAAVLLMEILDGLDGRLARRYGPTVFGSAWDMESDAFVILLLSSGAVLFAGLPVWALWPGLARYLFYFPYKFLKPPSVRMPALWSFFSKTVCVAAVFCMAAPWYWPSAARAAAAVISLLLAVSFLWEGVLYIQVRIQTRNR